MEEELIRLEKELNELENIEGDVWKPINKWEKQFWESVGRNSKYGWCAAEFEKINSINNGIKFPKDSFRGRLKSYEELFGKIKESE